MVFKLIRGGRRVAEIEKSLENNIEFSKYMERRTDHAGRHRLHDDIGVVAKYIDYVRFSKPASLLHDAPPVESEKVTSPALPVRGKTSLPLAFVSDIMAAPKRWSGRHVIIDGELEHVSSNRSGEHWHRFGDHTGAVMAVGSEMMDMHKGTLFGVARQTAVGKQLFLEIKNFHPLSEGSGSVE